MDWVNQLKLKAGSDDAVADSCEDSVESLGFTKGGHFLD